MALDNSHYFVCLLKELADYEEQIYCNPEWQNLKKHYYSAYCSFMDKTYQLRPGTGFHIWSIKEKEYDADQVTLLLNPDIDALVSFCISLHKMGLHTQWASNETNWLVFVYKKVTQQ